MDKPNCLLFKDGDDWIVFAPLSHFAFRVNEQAANGFRGFIDRGRLNDGVAVQEVNHDGDEFSPTGVTIYVNNQCQQRCVYCYGMPARGNRSQLDLRFCRAAIELVADWAKCKNVVMPVYFHGTGEPTLDWGLFTDCVQIAEEAKQRHGIGLRLTVCTGGQVSPEQAEWIANHFDEVHLSLDGPSDIQNAQRPRLDCSDSFVAPLQLARRVLSQGKRLLIKCTVTRATVLRMPEIVAFVAREIGGAELEFEMMFPLPWVRTEEAESPNWTDFVEQFGYALDVGQKVNLSVRHQTVSLSAIREGNHAFLCLTPPNIVTAFHDVPNERDADAVLGAYGWYDSMSDSILFDHEKRLLIQKDQSMPACEGCPCWMICSSPGAVKSRLAVEHLEGNSVCLTRVGILKELLRRAVPRHTHTQEKVS